MLTSASAESRDSVGFSGFGRLRTSCMRGSAAAAQSAPPCAGAGALTPTLAFTLDWDRFQRLLGLINR